MRLKIQNLNSKMQAVLVPQRFAGRSASSLVGTRNLMNCLGIVLHNRLGKVGVVGHVEAQSTSQEYDRATQAALARMFADLNANGGGTGSLSLVLLGNMGAHKAAIPIDREFFSDRITMADFADLRVPPDKKGEKAQVGACILDPKNEILYTDALGKNIGEAAPDKAVAIYELQKVSAVQGSAATGSGGTRT
jgi:hypothetical protein